MCDLGGAYGRVDPPRIPSPLFESKHMCTRPMFLALRKTIVSRFAAPAAGDRTKIIRSAHWDRFGAPIQSWLGSGFIQTLSVEARRRLRGRNAKPSGSAWNQHQDLILTTELNEPGCSVSALKPDGCVTLLIPRSREPGDRTGGVTRGCGVADPSITRL